MKTAPQFLKRAAEIMNERAKQYDKPDGERSMGKAIAAFNTVTGRKLRESEGWLLMLLLKQVRLFQHPGFHLDSAEDAIAYAALLAEAKQNEHGALWRTMRQFASAPPDNPTAEEDEAFRKMFLDAKAQ
jgi:hypothetical protein